MDRAVSIYSTSGARTMYLSVTYHNIVDCFPVSLMHHVFGLQSVTELIKLPLMAIVPPRMVFSADLSGSGATTTHKNTRSLKTN
jgi:hypothetical protein